ncbi:DUF4397 domain-containing protein [Bacillus sp. AGMB 02131]|uniref:DUF4397 domain-containing protein n=1 Tax=Peribacillus faecalis TaxID=2772559 RepID=A0A927HCT3_9BACI|nr:DUF4397 domain-containing protein [Peribacillus faecalis]MBD3109851.1 DUF4397 domain-containing protein [Peribacillus faecalis]
MTSDRTDAYFQKASKYGMLADYYKYHNPPLHMHYYKKHLNNLQKGMLAERAAMARSEGVQPAKIRILHAIPDGPNVDVLLNGTRVLKDFPYKKVTDYLSVPEGKYQVDVYPTGNHVSSLLSRKVNVESGKSYTVAAAGSGNKLYLQTYEDKFNVPSGLTNVRFIHLSPNAGPVDVGVKGGNNLFTNVSFRKGTDYLSVYPANVDLEVKKAGTSDVALSLPNVNLLPNTAYTVYAIGLAGDEPSLEALILVP